MADPDDWHCKTPLPPQLPLPEGVALPYGWAPYAGTICRTKSDAEVLVSRTWTWCVEARCEIDQFGFTRKGVHVLGGHNVYGWFPHDAAKANVLTSLDLVSLKNLLECFPDQGYPWWDVRCGYDCRYKSPTTVILSDVKRELGAFNLATAEGRYDNNNKDSDGRDIDGYDSEGYNEHGVDRHGFHQDGAFVGLDKRHHKKRFRIGLKVGKARVTGNPTGRPRRPNSNGMPRRDEGPCYHDMITWGVNDSVWQLTCKGCKGGKWLPIAAFAPDPRKPCEREDFDVFAQLHEQLKSPIDQIFVAATVKLGFKPKHREARSNDDVDGDGLTPLWQLQDSLVRQWSLPALKEERTYRMAQCRMCREKNRKAEVDRTPEQADEFERQEERWDALIADPARNMLHAAFRNGAESLPDAVEELASAVRQLGEQMGPAPERTVVATTN